MSFFDRIDNWLDDLADRFRGDLEVNRREDRDLELEGETNDVPDNLVEDPNVDPKIVSIKFNAKEDALNHHCDKYEVVERGKGAVVVRRGGNLTLEVSLNSKVDLKAKQDLTLYFSFGTRPNVVRGTQARLHVSGKRLLDKNHLEWDSRVVEAKGATVTLEVQVPSDAPVGVWRVAGQVKRRGGGGAGETHVFRQDKTIYILFNPWNKHDGCYLQDDELRDEYVLQDVGRVWVGNHPYPYGRSWVFGQFDDAVLPAVELIMQRSGLAPEARGDPVKVSRVISKMVNSNGDNGVLVGKWAKEPEEYKDGSMPSSWTGSIDILENYLRTHKPVKYGQCWVFAGVVNTVCRALGIPSRVVSNFGSAHDTNVSLSIDEYYDEDGDELDSNYRGAPVAGINDSIWNFHVWNDVWMTRPDLPDGYGGWQAIDATPQESSDGWMQCGPASHEAIRRGQLDLNYDVPFVLAEVNADVVSWQRDELAQDGFKKLNANTNRVGKALLTQKPGSHSGEDVTNQYKPPEGTSAERVTLLAAARGTRAARRAYRLPSEVIDDVEFSIADLDQVNIGNPYTVTLTAKNTSSKLRTVRVVLRSSSMYYTGVVAERIAKNEGELSLQPGQSDSVTLQVRYSDYYEKLVEHAMVKNTAICNVKETSYSWVGDDRMEITKPELKVEVLGEGVVGQALPIRVSFTNPLPITLRNSRLVLDGPGLTRPKTIPVKDVGPHSEMEVRLKVYPKKPKNCTMVASFNSIQLLNLSGSANVIINPVD